MSLSSSMRLLAVAVALVALPSLAIADTITFSAPSITLSESNSVQTGYFDVIVTDHADANNNLNAGGTQTSTNGTDIIFDSGVELSTNGGPGGVVTFPNSDDQTQLATVGGTFTYLYSTNSDVDPTFNGSGSNNQFDNQDVFLEDGASNAGTSLSAGTPLGLLRVEYSIPAGFEGVATLAVGTANNNALAPAAWSDTFFNNNVPLTVDGSITVVPEPTSVVLLVLGAIGLFGIRRMRAR